MRTTAIAFLLCLCIPWLAISQDMTAREDIPANYLTAGPSSGINAGSKTMAPLGVTTILHDNGPLVNSPGGGFNGHDASMLQGNLGMTTIGWGNQISVSNHVADNFTVNDASGWRVDSLAFFSYQSNSDTFSTINAVHLLIWDGPPNNPASTVIWGDTSVNIILNTRWTGIYRTTNTTPTATNRPVMITTAQIGGLALGLGDYWLDWSIGGTLSSGPWAPPITINGDSTTGNALQKTSSGWANAVDGGTLTQQGFPFLVYGEIAGVEIHDIGASALFTVSAPPFASNPAQRSREIQNADAASATAPPASPTIVALHKESNSFTLKVVVRNFGSFTEPTYQVGWKVDDTVQTTVPSTDSLRVGGMDTLDLVWTSSTTGPHTAIAWTILAADSNHSNDTTPPFNFEILPGDVLLQEGFNGATFPPAGWITINRDGGGTSGPWFPGNVGVFPPFEGASYAADNFNTANGRYIDDYLITPNTGGLVTESVDSLTFWLRSAASIYPDSMEVRVSTTTADTAAFTTLLQYINVPKTGWVRFAYALPNAANRYVAFRYLMFDGGSGPNSDYFGLDDVRIIRYGASSVGDDLSGVPKMFVLNPNYPNPFNPSTTITYGLPEESAVHLRVYDVLGREVAVLLNDVQHAGMHQAVWNGITDTGVRVASGMYFVRMEAISTRDGGSFVSVQKMLLTK